MVCYCIYSFLKAELFKCMETLDRYFSQVIIITTGTSHHIYKKIVFEFSLEWRISHEAGAIVQTIVYDVLCPKMYGMYIHRPLHV
jgi:hypothetical protein